MPSKGVSNPSRHTRPDTFLVSTCAHRFGLGIAKRNPYSDRFLASPLDLFYPGRIGLWKMQASVNKESHSELGTALRSV